jgi:hypothetical protein
MRKSGTYHDQTPPRCVASAAHQPQAHKCYDGESIVGGWSASTTLSNGLWTSRWVLWLMKPACGTYS